MKRVLLTCIIFIGMITIGCQKPVSTGSKEKPLVIVSVSPYVSIVQAIAGDSVIVKPAIQPNFDPHTMEVTPSQRALIQQADLFIAIGETFEHKLLSALREHNKGLHILQLNEKIPTLHYSGKTYFIDACKDEQLHNKDSQDVHFWLSLKLLPIQAIVIADALSQINPDQEHLYSDQADAYINKVKKLDAQIQNMLHAYQGKALLVPHAALGYFCADYNLVQIAVECEGKSPLPNDISRILDLAKHSNVVCGFTFPQFNNKGVELIAKKLNIRTSSFDPLGEDVLESIEQIATNITK